MRKRRREKQRAANEAVSESGPDKAEPEGARQVTDSCALLSSPVHAERVLLTHFRPAKVARALGVCEKTIYRWVSNGLLLGVRVGGAVLVPETEVTRLTALNDARAKAKARETAEVTGPAGRENTKGTACRAISAAFNRAGLGYAQSEYASMQRGAPTFIVWTPAPDAADIRGVAVWIKNERQKPTPAQMEAETTLARWRYKTLFVFSADDCLSEMKKLGYRGLEKR